MVPHNELLFKPWRMGVTGPLWKWFQSYLCNRLHYTSVFDTSSAYLQVKSGVPQGSVLGPLLFLIYINDLPDGICFSLLSLFADDTKIMKPIISPTCQQELQHDLNCLSSWCSEWKLKLNLSKCAAMCVTISSRSRIAPASYNIQHQQISSTNKQKDLGVLFTSKLSWLDHFNIICISFIKSNPTINTIMFLKCN